MKFVDTAIVDADVIIYVTDVIEKFDKNSNYLEKVKKTDIPVILLINKIDLSDQNKVIELANMWKAELPQAVILPISATENSI